MATLGEQIKRAREKKNLSQEELAGLMRVSRQAISKWENDLSIPQGENRRRLAEVLELVPTEEETVKEAGAEKASAGGRSVSGGNLVGWAVAALLLMALVGTWVYHYRHRGDGTEDLSGTGALTEQFNNGSQQTKAGTPAWKDILFYDREQVEIVAEGLPYNSAKIDSILVQWDGDGAKSIDMYYVPTVTETDISQNRQLLLTKAVPENRSAVLLDSESLKRLLPGQIYFELKFEKEVLISEKYSVVYDPAVLAYIREFDGENIVFDEVEWVDIPSERSTELGLTGIDVGYEVYNESDTLTELTISDDCICTVLDWTADYQEMQVTPEGLADILKEREGLSIPYRLVTENNEVISISEHYVP